MNKYYCPEQRLRGIQSGNPEQRRRDIQRFPEQRLRGIQSGNPEQRRRGIQSGNPE